MRSRAATDELVAAFAAFAETKAKEALLPADVTFASVNGMDALSNLPLCGASRWKRWPAPHRGRSEAWLRLRSGARPASAARHVHVESVMFVPINVDHFV
ncbi:hypothetical protein NKI12_28020 [Mesorhizobium australicum]|uniref:Uncharacterized protein n=1 Tax=Mesorhizobium australicum TaxID=536018 RepID=A0ACC6T6X9_9HYPH